ncbi:phage tail tape measure protein [Salipiger sp. PrR007]|uniref:phage tail tape measure protein n=1 Tax=Salipiger sp. PrR007 TaxID=2706884 RepID=UPI0013BA06B9|nr:phage tail tape measure protein [Salipiger sp. PrR007]NDW30963.1 phage tail tape measure protein [Salipiger sp. PrR007]
MADEELERITILLQARDKDFARAIDRNNKLIARLQRDATQNTSKMARDIDSNLNKAAASVGNLTKAFAAGAAATAVGVLTSNLRQGVNAIAQIGDEARRSGLGVEAFQQLSYVASQSRIPIDAVVDGMKELNLRADEFVVTGKGSAADAFARLGLGAADLQRQLEKPEELLLDIIGRMEDLDRAAQIRVADEIFGGTGGERFVELLAKGEDGIRSMMEQAEEMGLVIDAELIAKAQRIDAEFSRMMDKASTWAKGLAVALADIPFDVIETRLKEIFPDEAQGRAVLGDEIYDSLSDLNDLTDEQVASARALSAEYSRLGEEAARMRPSLDQAVNMLMAFGYTDAAAAIMAARDEMLELNQGLQDGTVSAGDFEDGMRTAVDQASAALAQIDEIDRSTFSGVIAQIGALAASLGEAAARAAEVRRNFPGGTPGMTRAPEGPVDFQLPPGRNAPTSSPRPQLPSVDFSFGVPDAPKKKRNGGSGGKKKKDEWAEELERTREQIARLEAESASLLVAAEYGTELGDAMEYARTRAELLHAAQQAGKEITPELTKQVDELARAHMEAALAAEENSDRLDQFQDNAQRGADAMADFFGSILDGSQSAEDALRSLVGQMLRAQLNSAFTGIADAGGASGGFLATIGAALSGKRAGGGGVRGGHAYLVNENTPNSEVFVPSQSGAILNVPQAQAALKGASAPQSASAPVVNVPVNVTTAPGMRADVRRTSAGIDIEVMMERKFEEYIDSGAADSAMGRSYGLRGRPRG